MRPKYRLQIDNYGVVTSKSSRIGIPIQNIVPKTTIHVYKGEAWDRNAPAVPDVRKNRFKVRKNVV